MMFLFILLAIVFLYVGFYFMDKALKLSSAWYHFPTSLIFIVLCVASAFAAFFKMMVRLSP